MWVKHYTLFCVSSCADEFYIHKSEEIIIEVRVKWVYSTSINFLDAFHGCRVLNQEYVVTKRKRLQRITFSYAIWCIFSEVLTDWITRRPARLLLRAFTKIFFHRLSGFFVHFVQNLCCKIRESRINYASCEHTELPLPACENHVRKLAIVCFFLLAIPCTLLKFVYLYTNKFEYYGMFFVFHFCSFLSFSSDVPLCSRVSDQSPYM